MEGLDQMENLGERSWAFNPKGVQTRQLWPCSAPDPALAQPPQQNFNALTTEAINSRFKSMKLAFRYVDVDNSNCVSADELMRAEVLLARDERKTDGKLTYRCTGSLLEIHNERITDLLDPQDVEAAARAAAVGNGPAGGAGLLSAYAGASLDEQDRDKYYVKTNRLHRLLQAIKKLVTRSRSQTT